MSEEKMVGLFDFLELRIPPVLVFLVFVLAIWAVARWTPVVYLPVPASMLVSILLFILGAGVCLAAVMEFRKARTTVSPISPSTSRVLVRGGVYGYTRNPMYLGFAVWLAAWSVWLGCIPGLVGIAGFVAYMTRFQILPEERALTSLFGDEYIAYVDSVRRWI